MKLSYCGLKTLDEANFTAWRDTLRILSTELFEDVKAAKKQLLTIVLRGDMRGSLGDTMADAILHVFDNRI
jgi:hypothetical protein